MFVNVAFFLLKQLDDIFVFVREFYVMQYRALLTRQYKQLLTYIIKLGKHIYNNIYNMYLLFPSFFCVFCF